MARSAERLLTALTDDLIELDLGPLPEELSLATRNWVVERVAGAGDLTRGALHLAGVLIALAVLGIHRRPYWELPPDRRRALAARLSASRLPVVAEYVKALRSLAIVYAFENRPVAAR